MFTTTAADFFALIHAVLLADDVVTAIDMDGNEYTLTVAQFMDVAFLFRDDEVFIVSWDIV